MPPLSIAMSSYTEFIGIKRSWQQAETCSSAKFQQRKKKCWPLENVREKKSTSCPTLCIDQDVEALYIVHCALWNISTNIKSPLLL